MATAVLQDARLWLWLLMTLARCGDAKTSPQPSIERVLYYGHLTIGTNKLIPFTEVNPAANKTKLSSKSFTDIDYQSDSDFHVLMESEGVPEGMFSHKRTSAVDRLLGMKPKVECVENAMTLKLHGASSQWSPFLIDRGNAQPLSLSKLPPDCGYAVRKGWRDLAFSTSYDGCYVTQEDSIYVLPLVIHGVPLRMACPSVAPKPPSVSCYESEMTVKIESSSSVKDVQVKVNSKWESLMKVSSQCGFSVIEHPDGVIISAAYLPCITEKDGMLTFEIAAKGYFKISCPAQLQTRATACPEVSSTGCSTTPAGPPKGSQTPIQTGAPGHIAKPQNPQTPVPQATQASHTYRPPQVQAKFPFYFFKPEFYQPAPKPDPVFSEPDYFEVPQRPQTPLFQPTEAPPAPVYPKKPVLVDDPSENMPVHIPDHTQFPEQYPFYFFNPEFDWPEPVFPNPGPGHPEVPQHPETPVIQPTQAPPAPVYPKKPVLVDEPSENVPVQIPDHAQFPVQYPFYFFNPEFNHPELVSPNPEPEHPEVPQHPEMPVIQPTQAPPAPVHPKKPAQFTEQFPFYVIKPEYYQPGPKPDCVSPESKDPDPVIQPTRAPPAIVYPKKPEPVENPPKAPCRNSEPKQVPAQFPYYFFKPGFYQPDPKPDGGSPSPKPKATEKPKHPQMPVPQTTQATLKQPVTYPCPSSPKQAHYPTEPPIRRVHHFYPIIYPPTLQKPQVPVPQKPQVPVPQKPQVPVPQKPQVPVPQKPQVPVPQKPQIPVPQKPQIPVPQKPQIPVPQKPHIPVPQKPHIPVPQKPQIPSPQIPDPVPTPKSKTEPGLMLFPIHVPKTEVTSQISTGFEDSAKVLETNLVRQQSTRCLTGCTVAHSDCCPLVMSFHQHVHHHNHFAPAFGHMAHPAASVKEPSFFQQLINHSRISSANRQVTQTLLEAPQKPTPSTPSLQTGSYQESEAKVVHMPKPDPAVKPVSSTAHQIRLPFLNSYMYNPENGRWSLVPVISPSSEPQLPASNFHSIQSVKELPPSQELSYPYSVPNPESTYRSAPDNSANSPEGMSISTAKTQGLHKEQVKGHPRKGIVKYSTYPWFQMPDPHQSSVSSDLNIEPPSSLLGQNSVPTQRGSHPFLNSFLKPNMEGQKWSLPEYSSDSPQVGESGPAPQKLYRLQAVPAKATVHNGYPKAPLKTDGSEPHPQKDMSSPKNSNSRPSGSGASFTPLGSPLSFKDYWKRVESHHS